jgi:hypothetical protein
MAASLLAGGLLSFSCDTLPSVYGSEIVDVELRIGTQSGTRQLGGGRRGNRENPAV